LFLAIYEEVFVNRCDCPAFMRLAGGKGNGKSESIGSSEFIDTGTGGAI